MMDFLSNAWNEISNRISLFSDFYWFTFLKNILKLAAAFVISLPLALEREYHSRSVGLRTFPLVAVASCGYLLIAESFLSGDTPDARARIMQGLMTGIGFIGGGAILKKGKNHIIGTATAVTLWSTGTVGAAVAFNQFGIAILVAGMNFFALRTLSPIKEEIESGDSFKDGNTSAKEEDMED